MTRKRSAWATLLVISTLGALPLLAVAQMGGGYDMGPGMMGGGYGPGAREGGYGPGYGPGPLYSLDLSDSQRDKIEKIRDAERKKHWEIGGKMLEDQNRLRDLYQSDHQDPKKIGAVYGNIAKLQQQMLETHVRANNEVQQVLTKEQREQLKQWQRGAWGPRGGYAPPATARDRE
jgi:Spy/CpxP family protein refolding chaperone